MLILTQEEGKKKKEVEGVKIRKVLDVFPASKMGGVGTVWEGKAVSLPVVLRLSGASKSSPMSAMSS